MFAYITQSESAFSHQRISISLVEVIYQHDIILDVWCILLLTYITIHYMKIKVCQKQLYTSQIAWPHLWAALMCLPNSSCLLSSCPCVSGDWTASGTLHAILYLTFTPPPNTSLMVTDQGDAICPDQSIPWPYKSLSKWQTIWNRAYILRQCQGQGRKWCAYKCTRGSAALWLISSRVLLTTSIKLHS